MDGPNNSMMAHTPSDDIVETAVVALMAASNDAVAQALHVVYADLPGDVVRRCERHRIGATSDYLRHMCEVRDALAPYGAFKDWCEAQGITYTALQKALSRQFGEVAPDTRQRHAKLPMDAASTAGLLMGEARPRVVGEATNHSAQPDAQTYVDAGNATVDDTVDVVIEAGAGNNGENELESKGEAVDRVHYDDSGAVLEDSARVLMRMFAEFRRSFGASCASFHARPGLSAADLEMWWRTIDPDEWVTAMETYRWLMDATQSYRAFMASHYHLQPPMANMHATPVSLMLEAPRSASARRAHTIEVVAADDLEGTRVNSVDQAYEATNDEKASENGADAVDLAMLKHEVDAAYSAWQAAAADDSPADFAEVCRLWEIWDTLSYRLAIATKTVSP